MKIATYVKTVQGYWLQGWTITIEIDQARMTS